MGLLRWAKTKTSKAFGFKRIKEDSLLIYSTAKQIKNQRGPVDADGEIKKLSREDVAAKQKNYLLFSKVGLASSLCIFAYVIYAICNGEYLTAFTSSIIALIPLLQAIKYHYWHSMLRDRKFYSIQQYWTNTREKYK